MINKEYMQRIGLSDEHIHELQEGLRRENRYRKLLLQEGIPIGPAESIIETTKLDEVDLSNEALLREKIRAEWGGFIVKRLIL